MGRTKYKRKFKPRKSYSNSNIKLTTYDLNKMAYAKIPSLEQYGEEWNKKLNALILWVSSNSSEYYMLLNNELHYYTVFHIRPMAEPSGYFNDEISNCLMSIGDLLDIDWNEETGAFECWLKHEGNIYMFPFFKYDEGVIKCHR